MARPSPKKKKRTPKRIDASERRQTKRPAHLDVERFRLTPFVIRLTEGDDGVHVPTRVQLFRTGTFKKWDDDRKKWIHFSITRETLSEIVENWKNKVRGVDIALDFAHKSDEEAAAWFTDLVLEDEKKDSILWGEVDWTPDGRAAVAGKKFRYISPDFAFGWTDNETGDEYGATLFGAGLTNRPVIKNMAPTVELTEVKTMAKKPKKISEMTAEELKHKLAEEKKKAKSKQDPDKIELMQLRLDEMSEDDDDDDENDTGTQPGDDDDDDDDDDDPDEDEDAEDPAAVDPDNHEALKTAHKKLVKKVAKMQKNATKMLSEVTKIRTDAVSSKKEADFAILCAEGKAVPAQKKAFLKGDMAEFVKLAQKPKFTTIGAHGTPVGDDGEPVETSAQDEILKLADEAFKEKKVSKRRDAVRFVLAENPELCKRYEKEMEGGVKPEHETAA